jgi:hypothetical protein
MINRACHGRLMMLPKPEKIGTVTREPLLVKIKPKGVIYRFAIAMISLALRPH